MCLQTNWKEPKVAKRNIKVYKEFERINEQYCLSSIRLSRYYYNTLYKIKSMLKSTDESSYDETAIAAKLNYDGEDALVNISRAFHSVATKARIRKATKKNVLVCIIPKGALYYRGLSDLYASNQIVVTNEKVKL